MSENGHLGAVSYLGQFVYDVSINWWLNGLIRGFVRWAVFSGRGLCSSHDVGSTMSSRCVCSSTKYFVISIPVWKISPLLVPCWATTWRQLHPHITWFVLQVSSNLFYNVTFLPYVSVIYFGIYLRRGRPLHNAPLHLLIFICCHNSLGIRRSANSSAKTRKARRSGAI